VTVAAVERPREGRITIRENGDARLADAFVFSHPAGSSYHRPVWLEIIRQAFGHDTKYLTAEADGDVLGVLPLVFFNNRLFGRFAVSMPFLNYGGVLADSEAAERALLTHAISETVRARGTHLELRHQRQHFTQLAPKRHKVAMELTLAETADAQWSAIDRKLRNQVRKAEKSGLTVVVGGAELLDAFYVVFARNMRDLGTPVYDRRFFAAVLAGCPDTTRVLAIMHNGQPIAAAIVHWYRHRIEVPWASSLREFNPLCANVLLYWEMLRFAIAQGLKVFDFGRSTPGEGTYQFKKQWGAEARELVWEYWMADNQPLPELNPKNPKFDLAIRTWQRLPLAVANRIGPHIVRHIP
jgi:FemAB-related protein (PEP-CTERM system-associated)